MPNQSEKLIEKLTSKVQIYIVIIGVLFIALCTYDLRWVVPSIFIYFGIVAYSFWNSSRKKNEIVSHIQEVTSDVNTATKNNLINSPIPLVLVETDGNIIWKSKKFMEEFQNVEIRNYLTPIVKEIKLDIEKGNENKEIIKQFNIDKKFYKIKGGIAKSKKRDKRTQKEYILTLYFIDETKYNNLFDTYNNTRTCIGLATIDNYEDIIQRTLTEERVKLLANIEKEIIEWINKTGGLIIKTERDTFVFVFEQQYLNEFEKEKFNILDKVKALENDSNVQITLSMAISNEGNNNYEKYKNALNGMDIVLGRGGDQAVVRKEGKYKFYGGKSLEVEKRTKVKARTISQSISRIINESENVVIMGHSNIDIDAFGSALGLYRLSASLDKKCYIASEPQGKSLGKFIEILKEQDEYKDVIITEEDAEEIITDKTLLIIVDTHKKSYVEFPSLLDKTDRIVVIDHHRKSPDAIENMLVSFHEVYASSTAELVTEILQYAKQNIELTLLEAESLYGGIMVDTKDFTFKTGVRTFEAAAYLRRYGVDIIRVKKWFQADLESYNKISNIIKNTEIINETIGISVYDEENKDVNLICAKAADELLTISDITASFVMGKMGEKICISGRSIGDINVQIILEKLGGGGHITLAGAQLEGMSLEEAKAELIIRINEYLLETE